MKKPGPPRPDHHELDRRNFLKVGGAFVSGAALGLPAAAYPAPAEEPSQDDVRARDYRVLGRTGFKVSDISMGCGRISEANVVRYAYDNGINYFDTAESYSNGDSERMIGEAMPHMDRKQIFITTKLGVVAETSEEEIVERFQKCQESLQTDYVDALYLHGVADVTVVTHAGFHAAVARLKAEGKLRHAGISSHGPMVDEPDSMEKVLCAAAEDGRFDLMLLSYNFMNKVEAEKVLAVCKKHDVGTTGMKMTPGVLEVAPFDPENPNEEYAGYLERLMKNGRTREEAVERIKNWVNEQKENKEKTKPFLAKHGIKTKELLRNKSLQWVLQNPDMHTICVSMPGFDDIDKTLPLSGTKLSRADRAYLREYEYTFGDRYCRHACSSCTGSCPVGLSVSTIMRYSYYYQLQGREKFAMGKYARLGGKDATHCIACDAPCTGVCPYGVDIQANLMKAHTLLGFPQMA